LEYPLDELIFTNLLAQRNGVELHGCGVIDHDQGLLFLGFSGAGKSTLARLWRRHLDATILSDDRGHAARNDHRLARHCSARFSSYSVTPTCRIRRCISTSRDGCRWPARWALSWGSV
jgi:ABC-type cobalamin/Fe3+-siderophores transport system ATPase subunit